jgi:HEAT repeat protein
MNWTGAEIDECEMRLASVSASLQQVEQVSISAAWEMLGNASGRWLLDFDGASRMRSFWGYNPDAMRRNAEPPPHLSDNVRTEGLLFVQSCNSNGYVRERALRSKMWPGNRLTCAAALIRTDDWVPQIAEAALSMIEKLASSASACHFFGLLDLVSALRARTRFAAHWNTFIQPMLLAHRWRDVRHDAMAARDSTARRLAYELNLSANEDEAPDILRLALADASIRNACWAMGEVSKRLDPDLQLSMWRTVLAHRLGAVRAEALRRLAQLGVDDLHELLLRALFDPAHAVRAAATHQLQVRFGESALSHWRAAFDAGRERVMLTFVLAELGDAQDEQRMRSQLAHRRARVRAAALLGLCRIRVQDCETLMQLGLRDPSARVVAAAIEGFALTETEVRATALFDALASAASPPVRARVIAAARLLPKWDRLEHVLALYRRCPPEEWHQLDSLLRAWESGYNRSYAPIDAERRRVLLAMLVAVSRLNPTFDSRRLIGLLS